MGIRDIPRLICVTNHMGVQAVEEDILRRLAEGDQKAVDECFVYVKQWAFRQLGDLDAADDVAQQTVFEAWRSATSFRGDAKPSTWLVRIAKRIIYKKQQHDKLHAPAADSIEAMDDDPADTFDLETAEIYRLEIETALGELTDDERTALILSFEGMKSDEIAARMGRSANAVRLAKTRALRKLGEYGRKLRQGDKELQDGNQEGSPDGQTG